MTTTTTTTTTGTTFDDQLNTTGIVTNEDDYSSSSESRKKPEFETGTIIGGKYTIISELGRGGCGVVYKVEFSDDNGKLKKGALKAEYIVEDYSITLSAEANILRKMQWSKNVCRLYACGKLTSDINAIVMSLTGPSISWLRRRCPQQRFTFSTSLRIAFYCLNAIEDLHCIGFIHRDIKASNFTFGYYTYESRQIRILDFGFARSYLTYNKKENKLQIRKPRKRAPFLGTDRYCSPNVHKRIEQGRRDDCWSWMFMLVELIYGKLPWRDCSTKKILQKKEDSLQNLFKFGPVELYEVLDHIVDLNYESRPDYDYLRSVIIKICKLRGFLFSDPYDWEKGGIAYSNFCDDNHPPARSPGQSNNVNISKKSNSQKAEKLDDGNSEQKDHPQLEEDVTQNDEEQENNNKK